MTTIYSSLQAWEVHLARHVLEQAGLTTFIKDENHSRMNVFHANIIGGVKLQVPARDAAKAHELLHSMGVKGPTAQQPDCPHCANITGQRTKLFWVFNILALLLAGIPLLFIRKRKCPSCGKAHWVY